MKYQLSRSFHTLTHWQSGGGTGEKDTLKGYEVPSHASVIPPVLSGDKVCIFPYAMKAKGYNLEYNNDQRAYMTPNEKQNINSEPVYGVIRKIEEKVGTVVNYYYYAAIYYKPVEYHFEGVPVDYSYIFGDNNEVGATFYETKKGKGKTNGKEYITYLATDKEQKLSINKDYTGPALLPIIQERFWIGYNWYNNWQRIPEWVRFFCIDETYKETHASFPDIIPEVTEEIEDVVKKDHPEWFQYSSDLFGDKIPLYQGELYSGALSDLNRINYMRVDGYYNDDKTAYISYANYMGGNCFLTKQDDYYNGLNPFYGMNEDLGSVNYGSFILGQKDTKDKRVHTSAYWDGFVGEINGAGNVNQFNGKKYVVIGLEIVDDFKFFK